MTQMLQLKARHLVAYAQLMQSYSEDNRYAAILDQLRALTDTRALLLVYICAFVVEPKGMIPLSSVTNEMICAACESTQDERFGLKFL